MASRKKLKKTIKFVSSELIFEIYFGLLMTKNINTDRVDALVTEIVAINREYVLKASRPDGKSNPKLVKAYYRKLYSDWNITMDKLLKQMESL